jgi:lipopolysaccharide/colanic/teichoic acid biosynthesis glycosyltransferase
VNRRKKFPQTFLRPTPIESRSRREAVDPLEPCPQRASVDRPALDSEKLSGRLLQPHERALKRAIDLAVSLTLIALLSPVFTLLLLLIALVDGTPVIYRRRVVGPTGQFDAFKFRSMHRNADAILEANSALRQAFSQNFKLKSDPRVTKLGSFLRKYSLDELPQLFNVLCGQMSLVGPRMITAPELEKYGPYRDLLLTMKPGITGHWQVRGRQDVSYSERVRMDVEYITHWRVQADLKILMITPLRVITGRGAY